MGVNCNLTLKSADLHVFISRTLAQWNDLCCMIRWCETNRWSSPSTFQCFAPCHFLVSEWLFRGFARSVASLVNARWTIDECGLVIGRMEDEFALMNLGQPSPNRRIAFPNEPIADQQVIDFRADPDSEVQQWLSSLRSFLLNDKCRNQNFLLIIKSPTHHRACAVAGK